MFPHISRALISSTRCVITLSTSVPRRPFHTTSFLRAATTNASTPTSPSTTANVTTPKSKGTGIVLINMGGPPAVNDVEPFLRRLFQDPEIIQLGGGWKQQLVGNLMVKKRLERIKKQYADIGGSPIRKWTELQGQEMCKRLDVLSPETAPHKPYVMFRYASPLTEETLVTMKNDGITRAVAFSQYPQFSCTTTGSSLNHLWREITRLRMNHFTWSIIDRWPIHPTFIRAIVRRIELGLQQFPSNIRSQVIILFSAHSLPMKVVNKGDQYAQEVAATVQAVMEILNYSHPYTLAWQSQVGPLPWLGSQTGEVLKGFGRQGLKNVLVVPIAFTQDHIETLYEIDIEYAHVAKEAGITHFQRSPSLNDEPLLYDALAEIAAKHLQSKRACDSPQYTINCHGCENPWCRSIMNPITPYQNMRQAANPNSEYHIATKLTQ